MLLLPILFTQQFDSASSTLLPPPIQMSGIDQKELEGVLSRVYARHLIPFELRNAIWKLVDLGECLKCKLLFPNESLHHCVFYGNSCPCCIPPHFCLSFQNTPPSYIGDFILGIIRRYYATRYLPIWNLDCRTSHCDPKHIALFGFSNSQVDPIREVLEVLSDGSYDAYLPVGVLDAFHEMKFEYIKVVLE